MKCSLNIEPVYHRAERQILAHAHLCVLAYLLLRLAENRTSTGWSLLRETLEGISLGRLETPDGVVHQTERLKRAEQTLFNRCSVHLPPKAVQISS